MDRPWKVILAFVGVFVAGAVFGGVFTLRASGKRWTTSQPVQPAVAMQPAAKQSAPAAGVAKGSQTPSVSLALMRQITQRIHLTPEQREHVTRIVSRATEDLRRSQREHLAETTRITQRMYSDVATVLSPEQREELELVRTQVEERLKKAREKVPPADAARAGQAQKSTHARPPAAAGP